MLAQWMIFFIKEYTKRPQMVKDIGTISYYKENCSSK